MPDRGRARTIAEWVTLALSSLLILSLAGYLVYEASRTNEPAVPVQVRAEFAEARQVDGRYILPVKIANRGRRTVQDLKIQVQYQPPDSAAETTDLQIDYLGEQSGTEAYLYFDHPPETLQIKLRPASYRLD